MMDITNDPRTPRRTDREERELASELRASFVLVIGTMAILLLVSLVGMALS
jgi:hypothetical protein